MGYVVDRWHNTHPQPREPECGGPKGKVALAVHGVGMRRQACHDSPNGDEHTVLVRAQAGAGKSVVKQQSTKPPRPWRDPETGKVTVEACVREAWPPAQSVIDRPQRQYRGVLTWHLIPERRRHQIRPVKPPAVGAWQDLPTTEHELSGPMPHQVTRRARSIIRLAVISRTIPAGPFENIRTTTPEQAAVRPPDFDEVTGLGVHAHLAHEPGVGRPFDKLKAGNGRRTQPLNDHAVRLLARYIAKRPPPTSGSWTKLVLAMTIGAPLGESMPGSAVKRIHGKSGFRPYRWRGMRHHRASVLIAEGRSPKAVQKKAAVQKQAVQKRPGHRDVVTALRIYGRLFAESKEQTRGALDEEWKAARGRAGRVDSSPAGSWVPESRRTDHRLSLVRA